MVIPAMDYIDTRLTTQGHDRTLAPSIRSALGLAKKTLNRYYTRTDESEVYRIAMSKPSVLSFVWCHVAKYFTVLHPRHKLSYFKGAAWEQEWIDTAKEVLKAEFERSYRQELAMDAEDEPGVAASINMKVSNASIAMVG